MTLADIDFGALYREAHEAGLRAPQVRTLLDVGCGTGAIALAAAPRLGRVYGLDFGQATLHALEANARARPDERHAYPSRVGG